MSETQEAAPPVVTVTGDAENGWIVDVHDGDKHGVYYPKGKDAAEVEEAALKAHGYKKPASPASPMPPVGAKKEEAEAKPAPKSDAPVHSTTQSTTHSTTVSTAQVDHKGKK